MALRTIIDETGLPDAGGYYERFPREPSPAGHLTLTRATTVRIPGITLIAVLNEMANVGADGEILLVCHGTARDLIMPVAQGGTSAGVDAMEVIRNADGADAKADVIRAMPHKTKEEQLKQRDEWVALSNSLANNVIDPQATLAQAVAKFDEIFKSFAGQVRINSTQLRALCQSRRRVLALKLARLEIRACNAGSSPRTLLAFKTFFGCKKILAPKFETFFLSPVTIQVVPTGPFMIGLAVFGRFGVSVKNPALTEIFATTENEPIRTAAERRRQPGPIRQIPPLTNVPPAIAAGERDIMQNGALRSFGPFVGIALWETPRFHYRGLVVTKVPPWERQRNPAAPQPDLPTIRSFVSKFIMPNSGFTEGRFPIAGFANTKLPDAPYLLPNEAEYLAGIVALP